MTITETHSPTSSEPAGVAGLEVAPPPLATVAGTAEELVTAQRRVIELSARVLELESALTASRTEQITDGADPRLERFWDKAGRIADHADYCDEYDRMAEAMNGPRREREYEVTIDVSLDVRFTRTVTAISEDAARDYATDDLTMSEIEEAVSNGDAYNWRVDSASAERA